MALLLAVYGLLFVGVGVYISQSQVTAQTSTDGAPSGAAETVQFVGSASCAQCHPREHVEWQTSQHAAAMQEASDKTVLGQFDGSTFAHAGVTSTFYKKDNKFWVQH